MFSRILIKLVDEAIIPAVVLLAVKVLSIFFFSKKFSVPIQIDVTGFVYPSSQDFILINSYSTLAMICVITVGLLYVILKSNIFHETHIHPSLTAKLFSLKLSSFIQTSFDIYSQGTIWLSYSYLLLLSSGVMAFFDLIYSWIFYVACVLSLISTYVLVLDVEREFKIHKKTPHKEPAEVVLTWGDKIE